MRRVYIDVSNVAASAGDGPKWSNYANAIDSWRSSAHSKTDDVVVPIADFSLPGAFRKFEREDDAERLEKASTHGLPYSWATPPDQLFVHIAPRGKEADDEIIERASSDPHCIIVTNDNYVDKRGVNPWLAQRDFCGVDAFGKVTSLRRTSFSEAEVDRVIKEKQLASLTKAHRAPLALDRASRAHFREIVLTGRAGWLAATDTEQAAAFASMQAFRLGLAPRTSRWPGRIVISATEVRVELRNDASGTVVALRAAHPPEPSFFRWLRFAILFLGVWSGLTTWAIWAAVDRSADWRLTTPLPVLVAQIFGVGIASAFIAAIPLALGAAARAAAADRSAEAGPLAQYVHALRLGLPE